MGIYDRDYMRVRRPGPLIARRASGGWTPGPTGGEMRGWLLGLLGLQVLGLVIPWVGAGVDGSLSFGYAGTGAILERGVEIAFFLPLAALAAWIVMGPPLGLLKPLLLLAIGIAPAFLIYHDARFESLAGSSITNLGWASLSNASVTYVLICILPGVGIAIGQGRSGTRSAASLVGLVSVVAYLGWPFVQDSPVGWWFWTRSGLEAVRSHGVAPFWPFLAHLLPLLSNVVLALALVVIGFQCVRGLSGRGSSRTIMLMTAIAASSWIVSRAMLEIVWGFEGQLGFLPTTTNLVNHLHRLLLWIPPLAVLPVVFLILGRSISAPSSGWRGALRAPARFAGLLLGLTLVPASIYVQVEGVGWLDSLRSSRMRPLLYVVPEEPQIVLGLDRRALDSEEGRAFLAPLALSRRFEAIEVTAIERMVITRSATGWLWAFELDGSPRPAEFMKRELREESTHRAVTIWAAGPRHVAFPRDDLCLVAEDAHGLRQAVDRFLDRESSGYSQNISDAIAGVLHCDVFVVRGSTTIEEMNLTALADGLEIGSTIKGHRRAIHGPQGIFFSSLMEPMLGFSLGMMEETLSARLRSLPASKQRPVQDALELVRSIDTHSYGTGLDLTWSCPATTFDRLFVNRKRSSLPSDEIARIFFNVKPVLTALRRLEKP